MENPFFTNKEIVKTYYLSKEMLIEKIESSDILWKEKKDQTKKIIAKHMKNSSKLLINMININ